MAVACYVATYILTRSSYGIKKQITNFLTKETMKLSVTWAIGVKQPLKAAAGTG